MLQKCSTLLLAFTEIFRIMKARGFPEILCFLFWISLSLPMTHTVKLRFHGAIYRLRFYSNSLIHIVSLSNLHNNVASVQKNRSDKSHPIGCNSIQTCSFVSESFQSRTMNSKESARQIAPSKTNLR